MASPTGDAAWVCAGKPLTLSRPQFDDLLVSLGVIYASEKQMRAHAKVYDGDVRVVPDLPHHLRIVVRVRDTPLRVSREPDAHN